MDALDLFSNEGTPLTDYWRDRLNAAPAVTEQQVLTAYSTLPVGLADRAAANYRRDAAAGARRTAMSHGVNDAAALATSTVKSALESLGRAARTNQRLRHRASNKPRWPASSPTGK